MARASVLQAGGRGLNLVVIDFGLSPPWPTDVSNMQEASVGIAEWLVTGSQV